MLISPKWSPGPSRRRTLPPWLTTASPSRMRWKPRATLPSLVIDWPASWRTSLARPVSCFNCRPDRPANRSMRDSIWATSEVAMGPPSPPAMTRDARASHAAGTSDRPRRLLRASRRAQHRDEEIRLVRERPQVPGGQQEVRRPPGRPGVVEEFGEGIAAAGAEADRGPPVGGDVRAQPPEHLDPRARREERHHVAGADDAVEACGDAACGQVEVGQVADQPARAR